MKPLRFVYMLVYSTWCILLFVLLVNSMPYNPLTSQDLRQEMLVKSLVPEGWGFFSKSPRDEDIIILKKSGGRWKKNDLTPISSPQNLFGIDRLPRAQSTEMAMFVSQIGENDWTYCANGRDSCLYNNSTMPLHLENRVPEPILKDTVCFIRRKPVPWAWRDLTNSDRYPFHFAIAVIK